MTINKRSNHRKSIVMTGIEKTRAGRNGGKLLNTIKGGPSPNPAGQKPGILHSKTVIRKWLEAREKVKNPVSGKLENLSQMDIITLKQLEKARKGDTMAYRELLDRMEGRAMQRNELTGADGGPLVKPLKPLTDKQFKELIQTLNGNPTAG